jgi:hypothetical protein
MKKKDQKLPAQIEWMSNLHRSHSELLDHVGADNVTNAKRKIDRERRIFEQTKEQLGQVVSALEVDNWRNAVVRARSLLDKLEREGIPVWLRTISPAWVKHKIAPSSYKRWLTFCREQYLVALGELEKEAELYPDQVDIESELELIRNCYMTEAPHVFIERVSEFISVEPDEIEEES